MGIPRPIVEFLGAIVGVDPDHYPKGDEDAMRAYAARYDALAADLRAKAGAEAQQAASAIATAWNGEGGRALSQQLNLYVTQQEFGGVEAIAKNAEALAQYLRDQADTIARTKVMIWAQVAIGIAMFILPAGRLISAIQQTAWRTLLRNFITSRAKKALAEGTAQAAASKAKLGIGARIKAVAPGFSRGAFVGAGGAALFGLGPNTVAQIYGLRTGQDGRQVMDDQGNYHHEEGWNWEETRNYAKITAWAIPIAGVTGGLVAGVGRVAVRNVNALDTQAWSWAGRRVVGAAAMTTSLPAAEKIVNGHDPTWDSLWRAAVMGAAMPSHPFRAPDSAPPGGHPDTAPVKTPEVREHTTIDGSTRRELSPDPPNPPEVAVKPDVPAQASTAAAAEAGATTRTVQPAAEASVQGAVQPGAAHSTTPQSAARTADAVAAVRSTVKTPTVEGTAQTASKPAVTAEPAAHKQPAPAAEPATKPTQTGKPEAAESAASRPAPGEAKNTPQVAAKQPGHQGEAAQRGPETDTGRRAHTETDRPSEADARRPAQRSEERGPRTPDRGPEAELSGSRRQGAADRADDGQARGPHDNGQARAPHDDGAGQAADRADGQARAPHEDAAGSADRSAGAGRPDVPREDAAGRPAEPVGPEGEAGGLPADRLRSEDAAARVADAQQRVEAAQRRVAAEEARLQLAGEGQRVDAARRVDHANAVARKADETLAAELKLQEAVGRRDAALAETTQRTTQSTAKELAAAERAVAKQEKVVEKANRRLEEATQRETEGRPASEKAAGRAHERTESRRREYDDAEARFTELKDRLAEVRKAEDVRLTTERVQDFWAEAEAKRLSRLAAELDRTLARLGVQEIKSLFEGRLDGWEHLAADDRRFLAIHEMIHRTTTGWGYALQWTQIKADLVLRGDLFAEMYTGEGKTAVGVLALGMVAAEHPVHFMTSSRTLADSNHSQFRKVLEPLGVEVRRVDANRPEAPPVRPTVYVGDVATFGWSMGRGHRVPGKHVIIDEFDAVAIELATQTYTHSAGAGGRAGGQTKAEVRLVQRAFDSGVLDRADFIHSEQGAIPQLTPGGKQKLAAYVAENSGRRQFPDLTQRAEAEAQARWVLKEGDDFIRAKINGAERILIVGKHTGEPLVDPQTLLEQRWDAVGQALEARYGLKIRADPLHTDPITTHQLLKSYDHLSGMSGTAKLAEGGIRDLYGGDRVVEVQRFNKHKLTTRADQHFETAEAKWRVIVDETIADLAKNGDPRAGRPQAIITERNNEVVLVHRLLTERLAELRLDAGLKIEVVNAERMASFIDQGTFNESMSAIWAQAGQPGSITIGNKVLGRGIDIVPDAATFQGRERKGDTNVYTYKDPTTGATLEAVDGGLAVRVAFRDPDSPRGTVQAINRAGRQGAPGEAAVYTSHQDQLFRNRPDALEAALVYQHGEATAARDSAVRSYTTAAIAHAQAAAAHAHSGAGAEQVRQTGEALRQAGKALQQAEEQLQGTHAAYEQQIIAAQSRAQEATVQQIQAQRTREEAPTHTVVPERDAAVDPVSHEAVPSQVEAATPAVVELGELTDLPPKLSSAGEAGRLAGEDVHSGAYRIAGPDGRDWVVKLYPDQGINAEKVVAELEGLRGAALTGFGPAPYGMVRATIGGDPYVGVAMEPVEGGFVQAEVRDAAAVREAEQWSAGVTIRTVEQFDLFGRQLLEHGYSIRRDLQYFVDAEGNFRPIDLAGVEPLPVAPSYREFWIARHEEVLAERRGPLVDIAAANAARRQAEGAESPVVPQPERPSSPGWAEATELGELGSLPPRLSSSGETGSVATLTEFSGAYLIRRPDGTDWVVKLYPDSARHRDQIAAELEGLSAASLTGYGPTPYGLVRATIEGDSYVGVAMEPVDGGFINPRPGVASAVAEAARWRAAVSFDTVRQFDQYLERLQEQGYQHRFDLQFFVDGKGNLRPIDLEFVTRLPDDPAGRRAALENTMLKFDWVRKELVKAAIENAQAEVQARLQVSESVEIRVVPDQAALEATGFAPEHQVAGLYSNENGRHVVYLVAENLGSEREVATTIHHELQHGGLRVLSPAEHDRVLAWLTDRYAEPEVAPYFGELTDAERALLDRNQNGPELSASERAQVRELAEHAYIEFALTVPQTGPVRSLWHGFLSNILGPALWRSRVWPKTVGLALLHDTARRIALAMQTGQTPRPGADTEPHYRAAGPSRDVAPTNRSGRWQRSVDGLLSLPSLGGSVYTALPGTVSAGVFAGTGQLGLAAAILGGTALAVPARALINRYADAADSRAKTNWADYRRGVEDRATASRQVHSGWKEDQAVLPRAPLALTGLTAPRAVAAWWTFPLRHAVPVAAATICLAVVVPPVVVGGAIGLAAAVVGSAQYGVHLRRARLESVRRAGDYAERSARQLTGSNATDPERLLAELTRLDSENVRLQGLLDDGAQDIAPLAESFAAISQTLAQYAAALERHGLDPHARVSPDGNLVSDSVLHRDPLHARNLADLTWSPGHHHRPGVDAENAALIAAKIEQVTSGRYGVVTAEVIRSKAATGRRLVDIAADVIYDLEQRRTPSWMARDTVHARALRAQVDFHRYLAAEQAEAVPARLTWLAQTNQQYGVAAPPATITVPDAALPAPAVLDSGNGLRSKQLTDRAEAIVEAAQAHSRSTEVPARLEAQLSALDDVIYGVRRRLDAKRAKVYASEVARGKARQTLADEEGAQDSGQHARRRAAEQEVAKATVTHDRHARIAASYQEAVRQLEAAKAGYLAMRSSPADLEALAREAADQVDRYLATMATIAPPDLTVATGMAIGWLPHLRALTQRINETLDLHGIEQKFTAEALQSRLLAEFGQLAGRDGAVLSVGHGTGELRIRLRTAELTEVLNPPAKGSETMNGQLPQGGRSLSTTATTKVGAEGGYDLAKLLARAPEGSLLHQLGQFLILKLTSAVSRVRSVVASVVEYALGGGVEDNRDESVLFSGSAAWEVEVRTDRGGWINAKPVNTGLARDESELKVYIAHSYTVPAPEQTVQLPAEERNPQLPEHVVSTVSGLEAISDRVQGLVEAKLGTVVRDQIHNAITHDLPGELRESTGASLVRPLLVDGEVVGHLELRSEVRSVELVGAVSREHWQEALRVGFSGASGNQSFGRGRSVSVVAGILRLAGHNLLGYGFDLKPPTVTSSHRTGRSASQSAGGVGIHVGVQRFTGPTQGYRTVIHHEVKVVLSNGPATVVEGNSEALLRFKVNEAYRHGLPVDPKVLRKNENGDPLLVDGRQSVEGDPLPEAKVPGRQLKFPEWARELGAGPWAVQDFTGGAEALRDVMRYLSEQGYLPRLDAEGVPDLSRPAADPVEWRGQLANLTELRTQFSALRLETGYDIAAQTGLEFTMVRTRLAHAAKHLTLRIDVARDFGKADPRGVTTSESVVILNIGSNTAGRSGGGSASVGLAAGAAAQLGTESHHGKAGYGRDWTLWGRLAGWSSGSTVNQVTLVESTSPVAVFHVPHQLTVTEVESGHKIHQGGEGFGARVSLDSDFLPYDETPAGPPEVAIKGEVTSTILDRAILLGLSVAGLPEQLPKAISSDAIAGRHVASFLNPRNLIAHPEWTQTPYRTRTVVRGGAVPRVAGVAVKGQIRDAKFVAVTDGVGGDINFSMGSHGADRGTNSGRGSNGFLGGSAGGQSGQVGGSKSVSESQSHGSLQIWGDERLTIEVGRQYVFQAPVAFQLAVTDGPMMGNLTTKVAAGSAEGMALFQLPERDAVRFYADRKLDLPLGQVADVVERFIHRKVSIDRATLTSLIRRYHTALTAAVAAGEPIPVLSEMHTPEVMAAELGTAVGVEVAGQSLEEVLEQVKQAVATVQKVTLPEYHGPTMGDSFVESAELTDNEGQPVQVLTSVTELASQVLGHDADSDPVLAESLYVDRAGKRWWVRIDDMLDPGGFVRSYLSASAHGGIQQKITVRMRMRLKNDTAQSLGETVEALLLEQDYGYLEESHAEARGQSIGVNGNYSPVPGGAGSLGSDRSGGVRAAVGTQLTELKRKGSFGPMARIQREFVLEIEVTREPAETSSLLRRGLESALGRGTEDSEVEKAQVELSGHLVQLIPAALVSHETVLSKAEQPVDHRRVRLPSNYKVAGTTAFGRGHESKNELVEALGREFAQLARPWPVRWLGVPAYQEALEKLHRVELENVFSASGRKAEFPSMATEHGHQFVPLPVPGHPRDFVQIRVQAEVYDAELVTGPMKDTEIGQVNRSQHTTSTSVSHGRVLPLSGGVSIDGGKDSMLERAGLNGGFSVGEQVSDRVSDTSGVRRERSRFEKGDDVVIVRLRVGYNLHLERTRLLDEGGEELIGKAVRKPWAATGEAYVTMFRHQYDAMVAEQESPAPDAARRPGASQYEQVRRWVAVDPREPSRALTEALVTARQSQVEVLLKVTERDGTDHHYLATPDGRLYGDQRDSRFAEAFATVHPRLVRLADQNGIDLRVLHAAGRSAQTFSLAIREALAKVNVPTDFTADLPFPTKARPRPGQAVTQDPQQTSGPSTPPVLPAGEGGASGNASALGRMATTEGRTQDRTADVEQSLRGLLAGELIGLDEFARVVGLERIEPIDATTWRVWRGGRSHEVVFGVGVVAEHALAGFAPASDRVGTTVTVSSLVVGDAEVLSAVGHELRELSELSSAGPDVFVPGVAPAVGVLPSPHDRGREAQLALLGWVADRVREPAAGIRADLALLDAVTHLGLLPGTEGAEERLALLDPTVANRLRDWMSRVTDDVYPPAGVDPEAAAVERLREVLLAASRGDEPVITDARDALALAMGAGRLAEAEELVAAAVAAPRLGFEAEQAIELVYDAVNPASEPARQAFVAESNESPDGAAMEEAVAALAGAFLAEPERRAAAVAGAVDRLRATPSLNDRLDQVAVTSLEHAMDMNLGPDEVVATRAVEEAVEALSLDMLAASARDRAATVRWVQLVVEAATQTWSTGNRAQAEGAAVEVARQIVAFWSGNRSLADMASLMAWASATLAMSDPDAARSTLRAVLAAAPVAVLSAARQVAAETIDGAASWYGGSPGLARQQASRTITEALARWVGDDPGWRELQAELASGTWRRSGPAVDAEQRALAALQAYLLGLYSADRDALRTRADLALQRFLLSSEERAAEEVAHGALDALRETVDAAARHGQDSNETRQLAAAAAGPVMAVLRARAADYFRAAHPLADHIVTVTVDESRPDTAIRAIEVVRDERAAWTNTIPADAPSNIPAARREPPPLPAPTGMSASETIKALVGLLYSVKFEPGVAGEMTVVESLAELAAQYAGIHPTQLVEGIYVGDYAGERIVVVVAGSQPDSSTLRQRLVRQLLSEYGADLFSWGASPTYPSIAGEAQVPVAQERFVDSIKQFAASGLLAAEPTGAARPEYGWSREWLREQPWARGPIVFAPAKGADRVGLRLFGHTFVVTSGLGRLPDELPSKVSFAPGTLDPVITVSDRLDSEQDRRYAARCAWLELAAVAALVAVVTADGGREPLGVPRWGAGDPAISALLWAMAPMDQESVTPAMRREAELILRGFLGARRRDLLGDREYEISVRLAARVVEATLNDSGFRWRHLRWGR